MTHCFEVSVYIFEILNGRFITNVCTTKKGKGD